jgi:site-specific recombinase XerC
VKRAAKACRLGKGVSPHTARKVYAVALQAKYGDLEKVREALSHRDVITTMIYAMADQLTFARKSTRRSG